MRISRSNSDIGRLESPWTLRRNLACCPHVAMPISQVVVSTGTPMPVLTTMGTKARYLRLSRMGRSAYIASAFICIPRLFHYPLSPKASLEVSLQRYRHERPVFFAHSSTSQEAAQNGKTRPVNTAISTRMRSVKTISQRMAANMVTSAVFFIARRTGGPLNGALHPCIWKRTRIKTYDLYSAKPWRIRRTSTPVNLSTSHRRVVSRVKIAPSTIRWLASSVKIRLSVAGVQDRTVHCCMIQLQIPTSSNRLACQTEYVVEREIWSPMTH
jgi:hypothetical protein